MRLFDAVLSSPTHITLASDGRETILPGAGSFSDQLADCPHRYALGDDAARAVAEEAFGGGKVIAEAVDIIRMPGETVWLEWWETPELYGNRDDAATRRQVGLLVEADETLHRGSITSFWKTVGTAVMLSPGRVVFDLDAAPSGGNRLATSEAGHPVNALFENARLTIDREWVAYYSSSGAGNSPGLHSAILAQVAPDLPMAASFAMLMMATDVFERRTLNLDKLNRQRNKVGKPRLSEMTELLLRWGSSDAGRGARQSSGPDMRLHHVRGHLVRRLDRVFWRRPHLRGSGLPMPTPIRRVSPRR